MKNENIISTAKVKIKEAREKKEILVKFVNLQHRYENIIDGEEYQERILSHLEGFIKDKYPFTPEPMLRYNLQGYRGLLNGSFNGSLDNVIVDLENLIGELSEVIRPMNTPRVSQPRLYETKRIEEKPRKISHYKEEPANDPNNVKSRKTFYLDEKLLHQGIKIRAELSNGVVTYDHDKAFFAILPHLYTDVRKRSFPTHGRWQSHYLTNWILKCDDVMKVLDWEPTLAA